MNSFRKILNGKQVDIFLLKNKNDSEIAVTNYGARVVSWMYKGIDVVVGFDSIDGYLSSTEFYYGATIGRYANRIRNAKFMLNGSEYHLQENNPPDQLHGGVNGFHNQVWDVEDVRANKIALSYLSKDAEEGYPGNLQVQLHYELTDEDELRITYVAQTDAATFINLTHHSYFNLNGQGSGSILNHTLQINADKFTPMDAGMLPAGGIASVAGTPFDFRQPHTIGERVNDNEEQLIFGKGYDHNFVLNNNGKFSFAAKVVGDRTGIVLETFTDQPGMQLYAGNFMRGENTIKGGYKDEYRTAFCLETQHFPDSPNQPHFPSVVLRPGDPFNSVTVYKLS